MTSSSRGPGVWLVASALATLLAVGATAFALVAPSDLMGPRVLSACLVFGALVALAQFFAQYLATKRGRPAVAADQTRRVALLAVGGAATVAMVWVIPWVGDFASPLGPSVVVAFQAFLGLAAVFFAAITVWGFARHGSDHGRPGSRP